MSCSRSGCNDEHDIQNAFIKYEPDGITPRLLSCSQYSSNHNFSGDENFNQADELNKIDENLINCPPFANNGCFIGNSTKNDDKVEVHGSNTFFKGCSMLSLGDMDFDCAESEEYTSCKRE